MALLLKNDGGKSHMHIDPNVASVPENQKAKSYQNRDKRQIVAHFENGESMSFGAQKCSSAYDVCQWVGGVLQVDAGKMTVFRLMGGKKFKIQHHEECPSVCFISGAKGITKTVQKFDHPIVVIGAGLAGVQCMIDLMKRGRQDLVCLEREMDFGGHSWTNVPNKFTKLQTERGTYYVEYMDTNAVPPRQLEVGHTKFRTWPSRDSILQMVREGARARGLEDKTIFNAEVQKVIERKTVDQSRQALQAAGNVTPQKSYAIQWTPTLNQDEDGQLQLAGAVSAWPGFLHNLNTIEFPGEDDFDGYIEYSSFDRYDYSRVTGKKVVMYGHGAFTIENVRTLCEWRAKKIDVVCRTRNLCGTKMTSWLVGHNASPCPATVMLDCFKPIYDMMGYDVWKSPSVTTDKYRQAAMVKQKTIFGVTDIYFLAGYYGLMEVTTDEIKRCSYHMVHTKNLGKKIECECIIKAIGTAPSFKIAKQLSIRTVLGAWVNGDPFRPVEISGKGVAAQNFGSFSIGPGLAPMVKMLNWFLDYPQDLDIIKNEIPTSKNDHWPAFVVDAQYQTNLTIQIMILIPTLAAQLGEMDAIKAVKTSYSHPVAEYLEECRNEWNMYVKYFKEHGMVDDRPDPEYPYSVDMMNEFDRRIAEISKNGGKAPKNMEYIDQWEEPSAEPEFKTYEILAEAGHDSFTFSSQKTMKLAEMIPMVAEQIGMDEQEAKKMGETFQWMFWIQDEENKMFQPLFDHTIDAPAKLFVSGVDYFKKKKRDFDHPVAVIGAGLGGIQFMINHKHVRQSDNFVGFDKCGEFGGHSWLNVPNKYTKLQTERGTYYAEYLNWSANPPRTIGNGTVKYKTWPSRDNILQMSKEFAKARGLEPHVRFNTELQKVTPKGDAYALQLTNVLDETAGDEIFMAGAVTSWQGFLHEANTCEFPGEEDFGGYIEYSSFDKWDYTRATGKRVVMFGHGAFTIENVRTLCEFRCAKVDIVCRYRNLCGTKMTSWLVGSCQNPCPAPVMLDCFSVIYEKAGWNPWLSASVKTNDKRSYALVEQNTIFGVTDIYFLAGYYGLMECTEDTIHRLTHHTVHTKNLKKQIECECIIKAIGTAPSWKIQKQLGMKSFLGTWANGDPNRPVEINSKGVGARNFGSFSVGPALAPFVKMHQWFFDYPEDFALVKDFLPLNKQTKWPLYVTEASFGNLLFAPLSSRIPGLGAELMSMGFLKAVKTKESHPVEEYLGQCRAEWEMYTQYFKDNKMVDDRPDCPYPYSLEMMNEFIQRVENPS